MARPSTANSANSARSASSSESSCGPKTPTSPSYPAVHKLSGARKIHYQEDSDTWDFVVSAEPSEPVDLDLMLPHYRARNQPLHHRMSMYVRAQGGEVKTKVCRKSRTPFLLTVDAAGAAPVTVYLPSDFSGTIRFPSHTPRLSMSAGFSNHIRPRVHLSLNPRRPDAEARGDEVEIHAAGPVQLRMWDVLEGAPESAARETWRKFKRAASTKNLRAPGDARPTDWDFLLDD